MWSKCKDTLKILWQRKENWGNYLTIGYVALFFLLYPIFFTPGHYFTLNEVKYHVFIVSVSLLLIFIVLIDFGKATPIFEYKTFSVTDWSLIAFAFIAVLSGLCSDYFPYTINGVGGRYHGALTLFAYLVLYFLISRYFQEKMLSKVLLCLAISASLVFLLGIFNYANLDPFGFYHQVREDQTAIFVSTIGNRNFFSTFVCLTLPIFMVMAAREKRRLSILGYAVAVFLGSAALCIANSDSGFVGMAVVFALFFIWSLSSLSALKRAMLVFTTVFAGFSVIGLLVHSLSSPRWAASSLFLHFSLSIYPLVLCLLSLLLFFLLQLFSPKIASNRFPSKVLQWGSAIFFLLIAVAFFVLLFYFSVVATDASLGSMAKYFRFSHEWGSNRGQVWAYLTSAFFKLGPVQIFIGTGPDTIYQVLQHFFSDQMSIGQLLDFDSAHNEYLQYLITTGIFGLTAYLTFVISGITRYFRSSENKAHPYLFAITLSCLCYAVQACFNISMITTTPFFFILMALGEASIRNLQGKR